MHLCSFDRLNVFIIANRRHLIIVLIVAASFSILFVEEFRLSRVLLSIVVVRDSLLVTLPNLVWVLAVPLIVELNVIWGRI